MKKLNLLAYLTLLILTSCGGDEIFNKKTQNDSFTANKVKPFSSSQCAQMHFEKPPVDLLFLVDNSGSTLSSDFSALKNQISQTIGQISSEFDFHIYVAPLVANQGDSINSYPLLVANTNGLPSVTNLNIVSPDALEFFSNVTGNNLEEGFERAYQVIKNNISNGVFRKNANLVIVTISNGDDDSSYFQSGQNKVFDASKFNAKKTQLKSLAKSSGDPLLEAETVRYLTLVAHSSCGDKFQKGTLYKKMSNEIYTEFGYANDSNKHSYDLCSQDYQNLFSEVNNSIRQILVGHSYDHWKISSASESSIQPDDITVTKIMPDGSKVLIPRDNTNGFEYLGYQTEINTRYAPSPGEKVTGLVVKLNGNARVSYPECIIAKTRTPTEYFGYINLKSKPDESTIKVTIRGKDIPKGGANGWTYIGYHEIKNIKVPGPENVSILPALNQTGYFIQLSGDSIYTNGDEVKYSYKPASL